VLANLAETPTRHVAAWESRGVEAANRRWAMRSSSETEALLAILRKLAAPEAVNAIASLVLQGSDRDLCRVNALDFAAKRALDEEQTIAAFLHASRLGLF
jgi:hypothetical protein